MIEVPSGPGRTFNVLGLKLINGSCERFSPPDASLTFSNYSAPYVLGKRVMDVVPGENQLDIVLENRFESANRAEECDMTPNPPAESGILKANFPLLPPNVTFGMSAFASFTFVNSSAVDSVTDLTFSTVNSPFFIDENSCGTTLAPGATCGITIRYSPLTVGPQGVGFTAQYKVNSVSFTLGRGLSSAGATAVVPLLEMYTGQSNWNDHVIAGTDFAAPSPCLGSENGFFACTHSGEMRRVEINDTLLTCANAYAEDSELALKWKCDSTTFPGKVAFVASGFQEGKSLKSLIDFTGATWKPLRVQIKKGAQVVAQTPVSIWWSNPMQVLTDAGQTLASTGTVYLIKNPLVPSGINKGFHINADKISVVSGPSGILATTNTPAATANCNDDGELSGPTSIRSFCVGNQRFLWLEVSATYSDVVSAGSVYIANGSSFVRVIGSRLNYATAGPTNRAIHIESSKNNAVIGNVIDNFLVGVFIKSSDFNILHDVFFDGANQGGPVGAGVVIDGIGADFNRINKVRIGRTGTGVYFVGPNPHAGNQLTNFNISNVVTGVAIEAGHSNSVIHNGIVSSTTNGAIIEGTLTRISNMSVIGAAGQGLETSTAADTLINQFLTLNASRGLYLIGGTTIFSQVSSMVQGGMYSINADGGATVVGYGANQQATSPGCLLNGNSPCGFYGGTFASIGAVSSSDFVGRTSDSVNTTVGAKTLGPSGTIAFSLASDWFWFANFLRSWNRSGANFAVETSFRTKASPGDLLAIYDFTPKPTAPFLNRSGNGATANNTFVPGAACPSSVDGNQTGVDSSTTGYLLNAAEILDDQVGNDDGFCQSNESCVYSPNFGFYQGHGDYRSRECIFNSMAGLTGIRIFGYPFNGSQ